MFDSHHNNFESSESQAQTRGRSPPNNPTTTNGAAAAATYHPCASQPSRRIAFRAQSGTAQQVQRAHHQAQAKKTLSKHSISRTEAIVLTTPASLQIKNDLETHYQSLPTPPDQIVRYRYQHRFVVPTAVASGEDEPDRPRDAPESLSPIRSFLLESWAGYGL